MEAVPDVLRVSPQPFVGAALANAHGNDSLVLSRVSVRECKIFPWGGGQWKHLLLALCLLLSTLVIKRLIDFKWIEKLLIAPALTVECSAVVYVFSVLLARMGITETRIHQFILKNSFGIYLYADPLNYIILAIGFSWFGSALFTDTLYSVALYAVRVIGTVTVSILITKIVRKCGLKHLC